MIVEYDDFRAKFAQNAGRRFVGRAVAAIQNNLHAFEREAARKTRLGKFDVAAKRVVNADGLTNQIGTWTDFFNRAGENEIFNFTFNFVVKFVTVGAEKFDAVVGVRIVRRGYDNARVGTQT